MSEELNKLADQLEFYANNVKGCLYSQRKTLNEAASALRRLAAAGEQKPVAAIVPCYTPSGKRLALYTEHQHLPIGTELYAAPQPAPGWDGATGYAERLSVALWEKHYKTDADQWKPLSGDLIGILTQIDNMTTGLSRSSQSTSDAGGGVRVKPLEWDEVLASRSDEDPTPEHTGDYEAASPVGTYYIEMYFGSDSCGWQVRHDDEIIADKDDPDNAKAAAQTHYEQRILSALSTGACKPSDRTSDVTEDDLVRVIKKANVDFGGWETDLARALLDVVGRR